MLSQSEHVQLPIDEGWFQQSLETIVWCTGLPIETNPNESLDITDRRELGRHANELYRRIHLSNWPEFIKRFQYSRANRLFSRARLHEIAPLVRSAILQPESFFPSPAREKCCRIVQGVVARRAERLKKEERCPSTLVGAAGGRLLLFGAEETLDDGAARYSSKGFFDFHNSPPWDTWVSFVDQYVVSWVPPQFLALANAGIEVNPEQCILWA